MVSETKLDQARERRKVREAFKDVQLSIDHCLFKADHTGLRTKEVKHLILLPFILGEAMGGAVALKVHFKQPQSWDGAILVAPMCKISDEIIPPWPVKQFLVAMAKVLPEKKLIPIKDLGELAYRDRKKLEQVCLQL
ncbi:hypothetical protein B296_00002782 [Ensete ventricosum]|uniref:Serine aminopeptidase S33 domain-containing protein n=1 Tax=Ensete ventricosum TaxID=4639 RepID=A0A427B152_ENSVE|nr:hypothetical protein B296_00002782 [Ensete ventricosum]